MALPSSPKSLRDAEREQEEPEVTGAVIIRELECLEPSPFDALASVTYEEAQALLKVNERGVRRFFAAKGCKDLGERLAGHGVVGSTLHLLSVANVEKDLGLTIGQQLALKAFLKRMIYVEKGNRRREDIFSMTSFKVNDVVLKGSRRRENIFSMNEYPQTRRRHHVSGCCPWWCGWCKWLCCNCCQKIETQIDEEADIWDLEEADIWELQRSRYGLTSDTLRLVTSEWADGASTEVDRPVVRTASCWGAVCGYTAEEQPQSLTRTDHIDLHTIQDVDNFVVSSTRIRHKPDLCEWCWGYYNTEVIYPAHVQVTYVDAGDREHKEPERKHVTLKVDPRKAEEISQQIIAGMEDARASAVAATNETQSKHHA